MRDVYFAKMRGHSVLQEVRRRGGVDGPVLDLGAGPGDLTAQLLAAGYETIAAETSAETLELLRKRFAGESRFRGAVLSGETIDVESGSGGTVFMIETIEHLPNVTIAPLFSEVARVLRPGGRLVVTTPYAEDLSRTITMCPSCGCEFHRVQHLRSLDESSIRAIIEPSGFITQCSVGLYFSEYAGVHRWLQHKRRQAERLRPEHLLYIGVRRSAN
jgi:SAM-dependent methyltransferase